MKVYKFGGASVKDAEGVKNIANVLQQTNPQKVVIVISAMGKTTNALENVVNAYVKQQNYQSEIEEIQQFHKKIIEELELKETAIVQEIDIVFDEIKTFLEKNKSPKYDFIYDQIVSKGEIISTKIVSAYFNHVGIANQWVDAQDFIKTDSSYREGKVDWDITCENLQSLNMDKTNITQGFIGSNENHFTTTLGREGSDYTGAIIAYCLNADSLTIWKDVPGVLNADPRYFEKTQLLNQISYEEAIELSYYGASVIHPKTIQPLQKKEIPLYVKSFENPLNKGTAICKGKSLDPECACYILKQNQSVLQISTKNFAFIDEKVIRDVFNKLSEFQLKVNLMQISAISLSLCIEDKFNTLEEAIQDFHQEFQVELIRDCALYTVRHHTAETEKILPDFDKILIQQTRHSTKQIVVN